MCIRTPNGAKRRRAGEHRPSVATWNGIAGSRGAAGRRNRLAGVVLLLAALALATTSVLLDQSGTGVGFAVDGTLLKGTGAPPTRANTTEDDAIATANTADAADDKGTAGDNPGVWCGGHAAESCGECPNGNGKSWCNGDCEWDASTDACAVGPSRSRPVRTGADGLVSESTQIRFEEKYSSLRAVEGGGVDCRIYKSPVSVTPLPNERGKASPSLWLDHSSSGNDERERLPQHVVHVHGLMHAGTGHLRQKLYDALANATLFVEPSHGRGRLVSASVQNSNWPCRHLTVEEGTNKRACNAPEDEGQHLQSVYPSFTLTYNALQERKRKSPGMSPAEERTYLSKMGHLTSLCTLTNADLGEGDATAEGGEADGKTAKQIGNILFRQWLPFWEDPSATFLLQKTPSLEALFHERVKVMPTFHAIVVRHPWTSPSWSDYYAFPKNTMDYNIMWAKPYEHIFETLHQGKIEWYAVVTYEALVMYPEVVMEELMEVIKSGMVRYGKGSTANAGRRGLMERSTIGSIGRQTKRVRRHLLLHKTNNDPTAYLVPKNESTELWGQCLQNKRCSEELDDLTKKVFPFFGFVSVTQANGESGENAPSTSPLSSSPGIVGVSREFGRVLYTSEAEALREFRSDGRDEERNVVGEERRAFDYTPSQELISNLKSIFA